MPNDSTRRWWTFGHVWLVISGPAIVVVAGFATLYLAIRTPDPVLPPERLQAPHRQGGAARLEPSLAPAQLARNHAAAGTVPVTPPATAATRP